MKLRHRYQLMPKRPANAASTRGLVAALAALHGPHTPISSDDAIAERERHRIEVEARAARQGEFVLAPKGGL